MNHAGQLLDTARIDETGGLSRMVSSENVRLCPQSPRSQRSCRPVGELYKWWRREPRRHPWLCRRQRATDLFVNETKRMTKLLQGRGRKSRELFRGLSPDCIFSGDENSAAAGKNCLTRRCSRPNCMPNDASPKNRAQQPWLACICYPRSTFRGRRGSRLCTSAWERAWPH